MPAVPELVRVTTDGRWRSCVVNGVWLVDREAAELQRAWQRDRLPASVAFVYEAEPRDVSNCQSRQNRGVASHGALPIS